MTEQPVIEIRNVTKTYRMGDVEVHALRGASLNVFPGEMVAIMGPSGSGKSTLMNIVGCLDQPTSGEYFLDGKDVSRLSEDDLAAVRSRKIGFVFQSFNLLSRTTALANVELPLIYAGGKDRRGRAEEALKRVGLGDRLHHKPNELSGGQQQRVAIARALAQDPQVMLFDEPTSALDPEMRDEVTAVIRDLADGGMTMLVVTHEMQLAHDVATRVWVIDRGTIVEDGPARQVVDEPQSTVAREYFGRMRRTRS